MSTIRLEYRLADLPSSQHRCGLAGLVAMLEWRKQQSQVRGVAEVSIITEGGAVVDLDAEGLASLFDLIYAASEEDLEVERPFNKDDNPPTVAREVVGKRGEALVKTFYVYKQTVPEGAFLLQRDPSRVGDSPNGLWIKLWRDWVWQTLRGVPAQRRPYQERALRKPSKDAGEGWAMLARNDGQASVELPSTYFLGAQARTAESVAFQDTARQLFLLHFWPFVASIYVPQIIAADGSRSHGGYAVVVPDISDLRTYCGELKDLLLARNPEKSGYRPKASIVDLPVESALDLMLRLRERLQQRAGADVETIVLGFDILYVEKVGNNVRLRSVERLPPETGLIDEYLRTRDYWSPRFRVQWLRNIIAHRPRWTDFDDLCARTPIDQTFNERKFKHDAWLAFQRTKEMKMENKDPTSPEEAADRLEALVFNIARDYVRRRVERKHGLKWDTPGREKDYRDAVESVARSAFLQVRSRADDDFVQFFSGTLCSVPQFLPPKLFEQVSRAVLNEPRKVRTLTLMALSAAAYVSNKSKDSEE